MVLALRTQEPAVKAASQLIAWPRPAASDLGSDQLVPREGFGFPIPTQDGCPK